MNDYDNLIIKNEDHKQFLIETICDSKRYHDSKKDILKMILNYLIM